jgi:hypothetical protein
MPHDKRQMIFLGKIGLFVVISCQIDVKNNNIYTSDIREKSNSVKIKILLYI